MRRRVTANELAEFYQRIGAAIWHVQYLEDALASFLTMKLVYQRRCAGDVLGLEEAAALLGEKRRMTFGPLLASALSRKVVRSEHRAEFEDFKHERHWLVHRSMVENGDDLYLESTRVAVFERIDRIGVEAIRLKGLVAGDLEAWAVAHGVDREAVNRQAEAAIRKLTGV